MPARRKTAPSKSGRDDLLHQIVACRRPAAALLGETSTGKSSTLAELRKRSPQTSFYVRCAGGAKGAIDPFDALLGQLHAANLLDAEWLELAQSAPARALDLRDALAAATGRRPFHIYIDDLHLAGVATLPAFEYCVDRLVDYPIRWYVTAAPGSPNLDATLERLQREHLLQAWPLEPLSAADARAMAESLAPLTGLPMSKLRPDERSLSIALAVADRALDLDTLARIAAMSKERALRALPVLEGMGAIRAEPAGYIAGEHAAREIVRSASAVAMRRAHLALAEIERDPSRRAAHLEEAGAKTEAAAQYLTIALEALAAGRFAAADAACTGVRRTAAARSSERSAAAAVAELIGRSGGAANGNGIVHAGRAALDEALATLPIELRIRCESAYYAATMQFIPDRAVEAPAIASLLESCRRRKVPGTAALYGILAKMYYGLNLPARAAEELERGLAELQTSYDPRTGIRLRIDLGFAKAALGENVAALELIEGQIGRAFSLGLNDEICSACCAAMYVLSALDRFDEAAHWGDYALAQPGPKSSRWVAILTYNLAGIDLQSGRPELTLGRLARLRDDLVAMRPADVPMIAVLETIALVQTDRFEEAAAVLRDALRVDAPEWIRFELRNAESLLAEVRGDFATALEISTFVMCNDSPESNARRSALVAATAVARLRYRLGERDVAEAVILCETLLERYSLAKPARDEAAAYGALAEETSSANARRLVEATAANPDRFTRALNAFEAAKVSGDRELLDGALSEFEAIGSRTLAELVRGEAAVRRVSLAERIPRRRHLTEREAELARHVASGKTNAEIASLLGLSPKTVGHHLSNILSKCGVRSRVDVATLVIRGKLPLHVS